MAAATSIITAGVLVGGAVAKTAAAAKNKKKYNNMIGSYERQDLSNLAEHIQVSTLGSDLLKDETARNTATLMGAIRESGARSITGATGKLAGASVVANQQIAKNLDQQQQQRAYAIYNEGTRIRQLQERRELDDLAGMGAMAEASRQDFWNGIGEISQAGMYASRASNYSRES